MEMPSKSFFLLALVFAISTSMVGSGVLLQEMFPFGRSQGDSELQKGDTTSSQVILSLPFNFYNYSHDRLFINNKGVISFQSPVTTYNPVCDGKGEKTRMVAPYWTDIVQLGEFSGIGTVYYRESMDETILRKAAQDVAAAFPGIYGLQLGWSLIVTWRNVTYWGADDCNQPSFVPPQNTFQAVLTTDGKHSFALFYYNAIRWTSGTWGEDVTVDPCTGLGGPVPARVGFWTGDGEHYYAIPASCTSEVKNVVHTSNINQPGKWVFRIDNASIQSTKCDDEKYKTEKLVVEPPFLDGLDKRILTIRGPCFNQTTQNITCQFHDTVKGLLTSTAIAAVVNGTATASCRTPLLYDQGRITLEVVVINVTSGTTVSYYGFVYVEYMKNTLTTSFSPAANNKVAVQLRWNPSIAPSNAQMQFGFLTIDNSNTWKFVSTSNQLPNTGTGNLNLNLTPEMLGDGFVVPAIKGVTKRIKRGLLSWLDEMEHGRFLCPKEIIRFQPEEQTKKCNSWYASDSGPPTDLIPCPPTYAEAIQDPRFIDDTSHFTEFFHKGAKWDFRSRNPSPSGGGQQCTYGSDGNILVGQPGGGTADKVSPEKSKIGHWKNDVKPWCLCCLHTSTEQCQKYYDKRPSDGGENYKNPNGGRGSGDPHFMTFDLLSYTFNGAGEFWMIKSLNANLQLSVQARTEPMLSKNSETINATVFTAFTLKSENDPTVQIQLSQANAIDILVGGYPIPTESAAPTTQSFGYTSVSFTQDLSQVQVSLAGQIGFTFHVRDKALDITTVISKSCKGKLAGLLGYYDGDASNDFYLPNGTVLPRNLSLPDVHYKFGVNWRINSSDSLFTYFPPKNYSSYQLLNFRPILVQPDNSKIPAHVLTVCGKSEDCLFDYAATKDVTFADQTRHVDQTFNTTIQALNKTYIMCPKISKLNHGLVNVSNFFVGKTARFQCFSGYKLNGKADVTCLSSGNWSGAIPICQSASGSSKPEIGFFLIPTIIAVAFGTLLPSN